MLDTDMNILVYFLIVGVLSSGTIISRFKRHPAAPVMAVSTILFTRIAPSLTGAWHWRTDSYFYYIVTDAILQTNHLRVPSWTDAVVPQASQKITLFGYHLLTAILGSITGVIGANSLLLLMPILMALLLFLFSLLFFRQILTPEFAFLAAFLFTMFDFNILHTFQYHQQIYGTLCFILILYSLLFGGHTTRWRGLFVLFGIIIAVSHNFTPLLMLVILGFVIFITAILNFRFSSFSTQDLDDSKIQITTLFVIILSVSLLAYQGLWPAIPYRLLSYIQNYDAANTLFSIKGHPSTFKNTGGHNIGSSMTMVTKGVLFFLSIPSFIWAWRTNRRNINIMMVFVFASGFAAIFVAPIDTSAVGRTVIFGTFFLLPFTLLTIQRNVTPQRRTRRLASIIIVTTLLILGNLFAGPSLSLIDSSTDINSDGYHKVKPIGSQAPTAGVWLNLYRADHTPVNTIYRLYAISLYYAHVPSPLRHYMYEAGDSKKPDGFSGLAVWDKARQPRSKSPENKIYSNGRVYINSNSSIL